MTLTDNSSRYVDHTHQLAHPLSLDGDDLVLAGGLQVGGTLTVGGGSYFPTWPIASVTHSVHQDVLDATLKVLDFDTNKLLNVAGMHSTSVQKGRLWVVTPGVYIAAASLLWEANGVGNVGYRYIAIRLNGSASYLAYDIGAASSATGVERTSQCQTDPVLLAAGDYLQLVCAQNSGATLKALANDHHSPRFSLRMVSAA